jgi:ATP-dependent DNA ligase
VCRNRGRVFRSSPAQCARPPQAIKLLVAADGMKLEGVVFKRSDVPYHSGQKCDWAKVKCASRCDANKECWRLLEGRH